MTGTKEKQKVTLEQGLTMLYFVIYLVVTLTIALNQPLNDTFPSLCNPPDEHSRYKVPLYICNHGTLPTGFEEELFSGDCKWTYGFYTLLPYMVQGYVMRFVDLFTDSPLTLLYAARLVNVAIGFIMAYIVLLLGKKMFRDSRTRWLFCCLITFLPQSLFLHTYVNPDSMCLLSTALMLYGLICGYQDGFSCKSCAFLTVGVILCALSYYNAYGFILGSMVLFCAYFLEQKNGKWHYDVKQFLKKGIPICVIVLLCISWSFIRNYNLYEGDFIGLTTMQNFIKSNGIARDTYASRGEPLTALLLKPNFLPKTAVSFIANYGSGTLYAPIPVYLFYLLLFLTGILSMVFVRSGQAKTASGKENGVQMLAGGKTLDEKLRKTPFHGRLFHGTMIFCIAMPLFLLIRYAYTVDFQAQGRYIMPCIIPLMYYVSRGLEKLPLWRDASQKRKNILSAVVLAGILISLFLTVYISALPYYMDASVL